MIRNISLILLLILSSCSEFLEEVPSTSFSESSAYSTEEALEASLTGCYSAMQGSSMFQGEMAEYLQYCSLLVHWKGTRTQQQWVQAFDLTMYSVNSNNQKMFSALYAAVFRCNKLIDALPSSPVDDGFKKEIEAEARLLRGILYFTLVRLYGDVPLVLAPASNVSETAVPRTPYQQVYAQIIADFEYAHANMRDESRQTAVTGTSGRPHRWAAASFLAAVYVQIACLMENPQDQWFDLSKEGRAPDFSHCGIADASAAWKLALDTAESVIAEGGYSLAEDYRSLFSWASPEDYMLKERIFVLQSTDNGTSGNYMAVRTLPEYPEGTHNVTTENKNTGRIRPERFVFQKWAATYGGVRADDSRTDVKNRLYLSCPDPRFDATFIHTSYFNQNRNADVALYPSKGCVRNKCSSEPYFRKYLNPRYDVGNSYADFYMMRYADVLLMAAEASASLSEGPGDAYWQKALDYVGEIHARARRSVPEGEPEAAQPTWEGRTFADADELVKAIMWERVFEMSCEGHEFFDTHRRGVRYIIDEITVPMNEFLALSDQSYGSKSYKSLLYNGVTLPTEPDVVRKGLLVAFPEDEIRYNQAIDYDDQNDFYVE